MSDSFFEYIRSNRDTVSNTMYGYEADEKKYEAVVYQAFPDVELSPEVTLSLVLQRRKSTRSFTQEHMKVEDLSLILKYSLSSNTKNEGLKGYSFPSGGGFYPIETYLLVHNLEGFESGLYHYSSVNHAVALIKKMSPDLESLGKDFLPQIDILPQVLLFMTMVKSRCIQKYGSLIYMLSLVESGHRGQNIYLCAAACNMGVCAAGFSEYKRINRLLGLDGQNEHYIYGLALGVPDTQLL